MLCMNTQIRHQSLQCKFIVIFFVKLTFFVGGKSPLSIIKPAGWSGLVLAVFCGLSHCSEHPASLLQHSGLFLNFVVQPDPFC